MVLAKHRKQHKELVERNVMENTKEMTYTARVQKYLEENNMISRETILKPSAVCEEYLEKHWDIWKDLLRILSTEFTLGMSIPRRMDLSSVLPPDILEDGKNPGSMKQSVSTSFVTHAFIVFHFEKFDELGLADDKKYFDFLLQFFVCLQTIHTKQSQLVMDMLSPGNYSLPPIPQYNPCNQFNPLGSFQPNPLNQTQQAHSQFMAQPAAFYHQPLPPVAQSNRIAELIEDLTNKLVLCRTDFSC